MSGDESAQKDTPAASIAVAHDSHRDLADLVAYATEFGWRPYDVNGVRRLRWDPDYDPWARFPNLIYYGPPAKPKRVCSIEGCDKPHRARGWCGAHYQRWWRHGDPLITPPRRPRPRPPTPTGPPLTREEILAECWAGYARAMQQAGMTPVPWAWAGLPEPSREAAS